MSYWWVNQGKTYAHEVGQDFMWSPLKDKSGSTRKAYENMQELVPGDVVFSHTKSALRAIGIVQSKSVVGPQPDFEGTGSPNWSAIGWHCDVAFSELKTPIEYREKLDVIKPMLPKENSPLDRNGKAVLSYLFRLPEALGEFLLGQSEYENSILNTFVAQAIADSDDTSDEVEAEIVQRVNLGPLEKENLVKSRRGQGIFKTNVKMYEKSCRVTGLADKTHLIASHIKPWKDSNDVEKIDGNNGLLLSPHIDRLFDHGFISFTNEGDILISPLLNTDVLEFWKINVPLNVGVFRKEQFEYLAFHRENRFRK